MNAARTKNLVFSSVALTALVLSVACTKGNDSHQSLPPPPAPVVKATPAPNAKTVKGPIKKGSSAELDKDSSKSSQEGPAESGDDSAPPVTDKSGKGEGEIVMNPSGMKPEEIFGASAKLGEPAAGKAASTDSAETLYFSGAGQDLLHEQLQSLVATEKDEKKNTRDDELAMRVGLSTFQVNMDTRQATMTATLIQDDGSEKQYEFSGVLDNQLRLRGGDLKKSGLAVEAVCMDETGGCNTVHMRIRKSSRHGVKTAQVIVRHSSAYIYSEGTEPEASNNPEYVKLMNILVNTANEPRRADVVRRLSFWTSEAINGRSEFSVSMRLGADPYRPNVEQSMSFSGVLVKPADSSDLNLVIARPKGIAKVNGKTVVLRGRIMDSIREVRMIKNDGRGNLQFEIVVRKGSARATEETIRLTVARIHEPVKSPILR